MNTIQKDLKQPWKDTRKYPKQGLIMTLILILRE